MKLDTNTMKTRTKGQSMTVRILVALAMFTMGIHLGCSEPVEDVDMTQPHSVKKSLFVGDWTYKQTIVDASPDVAVGFIGLEAALEKVRWEVTSNYLYAYRTHEAVPGLDEDATLEGGEYQGDPVAAFPIISHFDIRRDYNWRTGEQMNTIIENSFDRPWYDREYMRVDWGSAGDLLGPVDIGLARVSQATDYVRETEVYDPDQLQLTDDYIQITQQVTVSDGGMACYYVYGSYNCGSGEGRVRLSFAKIDATAEYAPRPYKDLIEFREEDGRHMRSLYLGVPLNSPTEGKQFHCTPELIGFLNSRDDVRRDYTLDDCDEVNYEQFGRFGFFRSERFQYDRQLGGGHDDHRDFNAAIHNIWEDPYEIVDGVKREKALTQRTPKPIKYYLNVGFPEDLAHVAGQMSDDWDGPFIGAVTAAVGKSEADVRAQLEQGSDTPSWQFLPGDTHKGGSMFQIIRNTCSTPGIIDYLENHSDAAHLPEILTTIEVVTGTEGATTDARVSALEAGLLPGHLGRVCAGMMNRSRALGAEKVFTWQQVGDVRYNSLNWINEPQPNGPLGYGPSSVDKETGQIYAGTANLYGASIDTYARSAADIVRSMNDDLALNSVLSGSNYADWLETPVSFADMPMEMTEEMSESMNARFGSFRVEDTYGDYRFADGQINPVELQYQMRQRLDNPMPGDPMHTALSGPVDTGKARMEALKQNPVFRARAVTNESLALLRPMYGLEADDEIPEEVRDAAVNMALDPTEFRKEQEARFKFFADNNMYMAEFIDDSIIGQALAMKGMDPEDVYRQLREEIFRAVALHEIGHTVGMSHNFEGSHDALNYQDEFWEIRSERDPAEWTEARIKEHRYTTIMEYGSRFNSDTKGLGKYDHAAIKFGYGHHTERFDPQVDVSSTLDFEVFANGYERIPDLLGGDYRNISKRVDVAIDTQVDGVRTGMVDNTVKLLEDPNRAASDYWFTREVPYGYCFDSFRGNIRCQTWDEGATYTETVRAAIQNYWNYYVFNNYRRGRASGWVNSYFGRQGRLAWYLTTYFRYFYFYQQWNIGLRQDLERASLIGLNFINQVLGTPEPGTHCLDEQTNQYVPYGMTTPAMQEDCEEVNIPLGTGRAHSVRYNDDYLPTVEYIGSYYDKINILTYLMDTQTSFFRISNEGDSRAFSIGYYRVFRDELIDLLKNIMFSWLGEESGEAYSSYLMADGVIPKALVAAEAFNQDPDQMAGMPQVYAPVGYNIVWNSLALATAYNTSTYDSELDFDEYLAITEKGSGDDRTYPEGWDIVTYTNPQTSAIYEAAQTRDGRSIGYDLLERANRFVELTWTPAAAAYEENSNDPTNRTVFEQAQRTLSKYNDLINDLRFLRSAVDGGAD